jgi:acetyl esterase/lipase
VSAEVWSATDGSLSRQPATGEIITVGFSVGGMLALATASKVVKPMSGKELPELQMDFYGCLWMSLAHQTES